MQHPTSISISSSKTSATGTGHYRRFGPFGDSPEGIDSGRQSEILLHNSDSMQDAVSRTGLNSGRYGHEEGHEGSISSEHSSLTSGASNGTMVENDSAGPHTGCKASPVALEAELETRQQENKSVSRSQRHRHICCLWTWKWEALSIVTSLGLLAAIVATLGSYNHGTHPEWPYNININSLISLFTTVIIAQLGFIQAEIISQLKWLWFSRPHPLQDLEHYDAASRGIMGALFFLGRLLRQPRDCLAVGAAFILLISAAIGPFTQQSIKSYACQRPLNNMSATLAAANWVDQDLAMGIDQSPNLKLITAALEGIIGSENSSRTVPFDCPTGDCEFPQYSSLGYCSSCADITSNVEEQHGPSPTYDENEAYTLNYTLSRGREDCQLSFYVVNGTLSHSATINHLDATKLTLCKSSRSGRFNSTFLSFMWSNCSQSRSDGSKADAGCNSHPEQLPGLGNLSDLVVLSCSIGLCVRDYTGRVRNGILDETMTNSFPSSYQIHAGDDETSILKLPCNVDKETYDVSNISQVPGIPGRKFATIISDGQRVTAPLECVFKTGATTPWVMRNLLKRIFTLDEHGSSHCYARWNNNTQCNPWYLEGMFRGGSPTAETMSSDFERVSVAISNRMRAVGSNAYRNGSGIALGTVIQTTVCVQVDWAWLILPAALVMLTLVLLVTVVLIDKGRHDGQPTWKSSALVAFFHGVDLRSGISSSADGQTARAMESAGGVGVSPPISSLLRGEHDSDLMSLESMHARSKKVVVRLDTAATGRRGFVMVNEGEDDVLAAPTKLDFQQRSADSYRNGEVQASTQPARNNSRLRKAPPYLQVDLGIELTPSIRSSLKSSNQQDVGRRSEPEV